MVDNFPFPFPDQIHNLNSYVRDFYFFRRNFYPQLSLVAIDPDNAMASLERQVKQNYSTFFSSIYYKCQLQITCRRLYLYRYDVYIYIFFFFYNIEMKKKPPTKMFMFLYYMFMYLSFKLLSKINIYRCVHVIFFNKIIFFLIITCKCTFLVCRIICNCLFLIFQAFTLKFVEIGKILFTTNVLKSTPLHKVHKFTNQLQYKRLYFKLNEYHFPL